MLLFLAFCACQFQGEVKNQRMAISIKVYPEDFEKNFYAIEWEDTIGNYLGYNEMPKQDRPFEIWCFVTNNEGDTLGYYRGLSSPRQFCYFQSDDDSVNIEFQIGPNPFSEELYLNESFKELIQKGPIKCSPLKLKLEKTIIEKDIVLPLINKGEE